MRVGYIQGRPWGNTKGKETLAIESAGCDRIVFDASAGRRPDSLALEAALGALNKGDKLVIWRLDRLATSLEKLVSAIEALSIHGIALQSLSEPFSTDGEDAVAVKRIFALLAEFDRTVREERLDDPGNRTGRPRSLSAEDIRRVKALMAEQRSSIPDLARQLGVSASTLYRYLRDHS